FGQASTNVSIQVGSGGGGGGGGTDSAAFVTQSVATTMTAGQSVSVSVTMQNNGTTTWDTTNYKLGSQNPADNTTWGLNRVNLPAAVAPGGSVTFSFNVTAPATAGTYNFQWQMYKQGVGFFGAVSTNVAVTVSSGGGGGGGGGTDNAAFVSQSVVSSMTAGQSVSVSVTMQNNGTTTWDTTNYKLGSQNPADNTTWGLNRVNLPAAVAPGGSVTFSFNVTAPATAGTYNFQWKMYKQSTGFFGASSTNVAVTVASSGGGANPPSITTTALSNGIKGVAYSYTVKATGGVSPYTWTMTGAPAGLTIGSSTGKMSGTPTVKGTFSVTFTVRGANGSSSSKVLNLTIL
ncbi:MAG: NBR1-Ig-like domain-containing protein, partial [Acidobacteriota bacterium]